MCTKDKAGCTPVHAAASSGAYEVVRVLCEHNDTASAMKDGSGRLPIHYAATKGHLEVRPYLSQSPPSPAATARIVPRPLSPCIRELPPLFFTRSSTCLTKLASTAAATCLVVCVIVCVCAYVRPTTAPVSASLIAAYSLL